jgi:hypothetical protein
MDGTNVTDNNFSKTVSVSEHGQTGSPRSHATGFMNPDEVLSDTRLTLMEKRAVLASWASDAHAVPDAPALRQLENGAVIRLDDILLALNALDGKRSFERPTFDPRRQRRDLPLRLSRRLKSALRRSWPSDDDDDDPPPCPACIGGPLGGPRSGGEIAVPGVALAA